jgi:hypothetical protein
MSDSRNVVSTILSERARERSFLGRAILEVSLAIAAHAHRSRALVGIGEIGIVDATFGDFRAWRG